MHASSLPSASSVSATQKRVLFVIAAVAFLLCFLTAATPVHAGGGAVITQSSAILNELLAGMATWHG
jgi:hypothetical protein